VQTTPQPIRKKVAVLLCRNLSGDTWVNAIGLSTARPERFELPAFVRCSRSLNFRAFRVESETGEIRRRFKLLVENVLLFSTDGLLSGSIVGQTRAKFFPSIFKRVLRVQIPLSPPTVSRLSDISENRAKSARVRAICLRTRTPESDVVGANRPNFGNPLCAQFPYVRPRVIGAVGIRGSKHSCAGFALLPATKSAESASHLAASERYVLRTAGTPKSRPEKENRDEHRK